MMASMGQQMSMVEEKDDTSKMLFGDLSRENSTEQEPTSENNTPKNVTGVIDKLKLDQLMQGF